jgi:teichoic acid transport system permease protein
LKHADKERIKILIRLTVNDFKARYGGSALGVFWGFATPMMTILIYWFVFQVGLKTGTRPNGVSYTLWMICGMLPWFFFSETISSATACFSEYSYLIKKTSFRRGFLPFIKAGSALIVHLTFIAIFIAILLFYGINPNIWYIQLFFYLGCNIFLVISIGLITSTLNVFLKDVGNIVGIIIQMGFWLLPIVWGPEIVSDRVLLLLKLNPMFYIVEGYRDSLLNGIPFWSKPILTLYFIAINAILFLAGFFAFQKLKHHFADLL